MQTRRLSSSATWRLSWRKPVNAHAFTGKWRRRRYTLIFTINAGRLFFGNAGTGTLNAGQLGTSAITINNGGTLDAEHTGADYTIANAITINSGGNLAARRVGTTTFSGLITLPTTGTAIFNRDDAITGAITFNNAANAVALTGDLTIQQGTINATVGQVNMNHVISGGFRLIKTGLGNLRLSGTSTYTGDTTILDGTIFVTGNIAPATNGNLGNPGVLSFHDG